jgi:hypothetical protein
MKPTIIFPDPMLAVVEVLRDRLEMVDQTYVEGFTVGTKVPADKSIDKKFLPYILVRLDGSTLTQQVNEEATIRISVWHRTEAQGIALAQACRALLLSYGGGAKIRVTKPLTGTIPSSDPESGDPLSSFTVAVVLRPSTL